MKILYAMTALALVFATPAALAQTPSSGSSKPSWHKEFNDADTNHDGGLSRDEIKAAKASKKGDFSIIEKYFDEMDGNHDGKVTIDERTAWGKAHPNAIKSAKAKEKNK